MKFGQIARLRVPKIMSYPVINGLIVVLFGVGYSLGIKGRDNNVELSFIENGITSLEDSYQTRDICSLDLRIYNYDIDGINRLELKIDGRAVMEKNNFENVNEYIYMLSLCNSLLNDGSHQIEVEMTDNNGDKESDETTLTIDGRVEWI